MPFGFFGNLIGNLGGAIINSESVKSTNASNINQQREINAINMAMNAATNRTNMEMNKANIEYQRNLNNQIFQREDSAYQRAVADAKAAGFSPLVASGVSAGGAGGTVSAPRNSFAAQQGAPAQAALAQSAQIGDFIAKAFDFASLKNLDAQTKKIEAETEDIGFQREYLTKEQAHRVETQLKVFEMEEKKLVQQLLSDQEARNQAVYIMERTAELNKSLEEQKHLNAKAMADYQATVANWLDKMNLSNRSFKNMDIAEQVAFISDVFENSIVADIVSTSNLTDLFKDYKGNSLWEKSSYNPYEGSTGTKYHDRGKSAVDNMYRNSW